MLEQYEFFNLPNWRKFHHQETSDDVSSSFIKDLIKKENDRGYIVHLILDKQIGDHLSISFYKKHSSSILKFILIGQFSLLVFSNFRREVDKYIVQTSIIKKYFEKPEFSKYSTQKEMYFLK